MANYCIRSNTYLKLEYFCVRNFGNWIYFGEISSSENIMTLIEFEFLLQTIQTWLCKTSILWKWKPVLTSKWIKYPDMPRMTCKWTMFANLYLLRKYEAAEQASVQFFLQYTVANWVSIIWPKSCHIFLPLWKKWKSFKINKYLEAFETISIS